METSILDLHQKFLLKSKSKNGHPVLQIITQGKFHIFQRSEYEALWLSSAINRLPHHLKSPSSSQFFNFIKELGKKFNEMVREIENLVQTKEFPSK